MIGSRFGFFASQKESVSNLLLDTYPATAAYSLMKLRTAYSGSSIKVRRSSDNTEQDIGFVDNELDTVSLLSFVNGGDGFVVAWYDQQGSNNLIETAAARQPRIVNSGSLELLNGKPAIYSNGSNSLQSTTNTINVIGTNGVQSVFAAAQIDNDSSIFVSYINGGDNLLYPIGYFNSVGGLVINPQGSNPESNANYVLGSYSYISAIVTSSTVEIFSNGTSDGSVANTGAIGGNSRITVFGRAYNSLPMQGFARTVVIYNSDQSVNRNAIENYINS